MSSGGKQDLTSTFITKCPVKSRYIKANNKACLVTLCCFGVRGLEDFEGLYTDDVTLHAENQKASLSMWNKETDGDLDGVNRVWAQSARRNSAHHFKKSCAVDLRTEQVEFEFIFFRETIIQTFYS